MKRRGGFTIVEMLMVVSVLAVLMGLASTGAASALRSSRGRQAEAIRAAVRNGIATWKAYYGKWPWQNSIDDDPPVQGGGDAAGNEVEVDRGEVDRFLREMVKKTYNDKIMLIDFNGLMVSSTDPDVKACYGMSFGEALKRTRKGGRMSINNFIFGYARRSNGRFCRFKVLYNRATDSVRVVSNGE